MQIIKLNSDYKELNYNFDEIRVIFIMKIFKVKY
jgi:hypothetical protein